MRERITSASRLLDELRRLSAAAERKKALHSVLAERFGGNTDGTWLRGLSLYMRLVAAVEQDLDCVGEVTRKRLTNMLNNGPAAIGNAALFPSDYAEIFHAHISGDVINQLELLDEILAKSGRDLRTDVEQATKLSANLGELIAEIENSEKTAIDEFLLENLGNIRTALNRYALYGPEGVDEFVSRLVGGLFVRAPIIRTLSPSAIKKAKLAFAIAKLISDALLYGYTAGSAIEWAGLDIPGIGEADETK